MFLAHMMEYIAVNRNIGSHLAKPKTIFGFLHVNIRQARLSQALIDALRPPPAAVRVNAYFDERFLARQRGRRSHSFSITVIYLLNSTRVFTFLEIDTLES